MRASLLLTVLASGEKLPPLVIFKGEMYKSSYQKYQKHYLVRSGKVFVQF